MGDNFFLDGMYNQKQINSINNIKGKSAQSKDNKQTVNGNNDSIFNDINTYKSDSTQKTNNSDLFNYIDQIMGMNDFLNMLDQDGDGKISQDEAKKLSTLDNNNALNSSDIDKLASDIKDLNSGKKTVVSGDGNFSTDVQYELDSTGKLAKKSATRTHLATNTVVDEYTFDDKGNVSTRVDKLNNRTRTYTYNTDSTGKSIKTSSTITDTKTGEVIAELKYDKNGKLESKDDKIAKTITKFTYDENGKLAANEVYTNDGRNILKSKSTYDENGRVKEKREYYSSTTGLKVNNLSTYTYDENGRVLTRTVYRDGDESGTVYEYTYSEDKYSRKPISRKNTTTGETKSYEYNENNELTQVTFKDKDGKELYSFKCNKDGTYSSKTENGIVTLFEYSAGGIKSKAIQYNASDIGADGKPKAGAKPVNTLEYNNGVKSKDISENGDVTEYDENGNKTKTTFANGNITFYEGGKPSVEIEGDHAYVWTYNSNGTKTKVKYNSSDIDENGKLKPGATAIDTTEYDEDGKEIKEEVKEEADTSDESKTSDTDSKTTDAADSVVEAGKIVAELAKKYASKHADADDFGESGRKWCTEFADYVLRHSGQKLTDWFKSDKKDSWSEVEKDGKNAKVKAKDVIVGDLVVIDDNHTAIVVDIKDDGTFVTVDGGGSGVKTRHRGKLTSGDYKFYRALA